MEDSLIIMLIGILFVLSLGGYAFYYINHVTPNQICNNAFFLEDSYFIKASYQKDTGLLICTLHKLNNSETKEYKTVYDWWSGVNVIPN